jgi:hypothetical protein
MFGPPEDIEGKCNARLHIGDDFGDNTSTHLCALDPGHEGPHREEWGCKDQKVCLTWTFDEGDRMKKLMDRMSARKNRNANI